MVVGIGHSLFATIFQVPFTNWSVDIAVQSIMLRESIKFLQSNLINSGLMDDIDHVISKQDCDFQSSVDHLINRRRESSSSFLGVKSRSFRNLLSSNLGKGSFLSPDVMMSNKARSTPSRVPSNSISFLTTKPGTSISTESNSSSLSIHNFLHSDQNARVPSRKFNLFFKIDPLSRTIISPLVSCCRESSDETVGKLLLTLWRICVELDEISMYQPTKGNVIEWGKLIVAGSESIAIYVTREEMGSEVLYSVSDGSCQRNSISFVHPLL